MAEPEEEAGQTAGAPAKVSAVWKPRFNNRLYCMVWPDHALLKFGLGSGRNARDGSALKALRNYLGPDHAPGPFVEWRAELPFLDGAAWGDCQRLEMVVATALKRRLDATAAMDVGFEWLRRSDLDTVSWPEELSAATAEALAFSGIAEEVSWEERTPRLGTPATNAHRTMRNRRGVCALKGCGREPREKAVKRDGYWYCSTWHSEQDADLRGALAPDHFTMLEPIEKSDARVREFYARYGLLDSDGGAGSQSESSTGP